jgi:putative hydrolase of the HAD superfamily
MPAPAVVPWHAVDTVLVDMDGTLLDLHYDNVFWNRLLPERFAAHAALPAELAAQRLASFVETHQHRLEYYCIDAWGRFIGRDLRPWKRELLHLVTWRADARDFLGAVRAGGRRLILATNAHPDVLALKHEVLGVCDHVDDAVTSHALGAPKEADAFWRALFTRFALAPERTLFIDDTDRVLDAAAAAGVGHLRCVTTPDSTAAPRASRHAGIDRFAELFATPGGSMAAEPPPARRPR